MKPRFFFALLVTGSCMGADLVQTPPMGWDSRIAFPGNKLGDKAVRENADALAASGLKDAGFSYVIIDDGWQGQRDAQGVLQPNNRFPDMKGLIDYIHGKGLKAGIYSAAGPKTCGNFEGSYQHEAQDATTWAGWGIDYLRYDWCGASDVYTGADIQPALKKMGDALKASGRPIVFSICERGIQSVWEWGPSLGANLWRITSDVEDAWRSVAAVGFDKDGGKEKYAGPGHWNDPGFLEIGNGGMNTQECKTQLTLWSILAAPLIATNDLRNMPAEIRDVYLNKEVIAIDQDKLGQQANRLSRDGPVEVWTKNLADGDIIVAMFNRSEQMASGVFYFDLIGLKGKHKVRELWYHRDEGASKDAYSAEIPAHGVELLRVTR